MYQWALCWCLKDTDPKPEYQEHWHYEDPEGKDTVCRLNNLKNMLQPPDRKEEKSILHSTDRRIYSRHEWPLGGIC